MAAIKLDFVKEYKTYYTAKTTPEVVEFGEIPFLTIEGKCVQILHIGSYSAEPESLTKMGWLGHSAVAPQPCPLNLI